MYITLYEYIENTALVNHLIEEFTARIKKKINIESYKNTSNGREIHFRIKLEDIKGVRWNEENEKSMDYIEKIIKKNLNLFTKNNYIAGYYRVSVEFRFIVKQLFTQRYFPNKGYLYHSTTLKENLVDIKNNGLELRSSEQSKEWNYHEELKYPPAVFASVPPTTWLDKIDERVIKIKTKGLPNKWWYDLNLYHAPFGGKYVVTYEPIPPKYLQVYRNGRWVNITLLDNKELFHFSSSDYEKINKKF